MKAPIRTLISVSTLFAATASASNVCDEFLEARSSPSDR
jgi:hypothetical protein